MISIFVCACVLVLSRADTLASFSVSLSSSRLFWPSFSKPRFTCASFSSNFLYWEILPSSSAIELAISASSLSSFVTLVFVSSSVFRFASDMPRFFLSDSRFFLHSSHCLSALFRSYSACARSDSIWGILSDIFDLSSSRVFWADVSSLSDFNLESAISLHEAYLSSWSIWASISLLSLGFASIKRALSPWVMKDDEAKTSYVNPSSFSIAWSVSGVLFPRRSFSPSRVICLNWSLIAPPLSMALSTR